MLDIFMKYHLFFLRGLEVTIFLTIVSSSLGLILGIFLALGKIYGDKFISAVARTIISIIRGTPLLVQLFIIYYGLPSWGIRLNPIVAAIISFTINSGAYQAEYLRGSIQSISASQFKAAQSIGMTKWQGIIYIILPQALRRVIPSWTNEFIYMIKYSSLAYLIGARELMTEGTLIASRNYQFFNVYLVVALIYLIVIMFFTTIFNRIEQKVTIP